MNNSYITDIEDAKIVASINGHSSVEHRRHATDVTQLRFTNEPVNILYCHSCTNWIWTDQPKVYTISSYACSIPCGTLPDDT